jgi:hypothetical protein
MAGGLPIHRRGDGVQVATWLEPNIATVFHTSLGQVFIHRPEACPNISSAQHVINIESLQKFAIRLLAKCCDKDQYSLKIVWVATKQCCHKVRQDNFVTANKSVTTP